MPFILPPFPGCLDPALNPTGSLPAYDVTMRRLPRDLPSATSSTTEGTWYSFTGINSTLYAFVHDDLLYYRTCIHEHESSLEWRHPYQGAPPWYVPEKCAQALKNRISALRVWPKTHPSNKFKVDLSALDWPGAIPPAQMQSVFQAPLDPPTTQTTLQQALLAACGKSCCGMPKNHTQSVCLTQAVGQVQTTMVATYLMTRLSRASTTSWKGSPSGFTSSSRSLLNLPSSTTMATSQ